MARCVSTLHHVKKGTPKAAAPPPYKLETTPINVAKATSGARAGNWREGSASEYDDLLKLFSH